MKVIDKIAYICLKDEKILATRSKGKDTFYLPGGKREGEESDLATLVREVKEELSVDIIEDTARFYGIFEAQAHGKAEGILVKMTCYTAEYNGQLRAASEIEEIDWLTTEDLDRVSLVNHLIFKDLKEKGLLK